MLASQSEPRPPRPLRLSARRLGPLLHLLGLALAGAGYWGPWVAHPTVALTLLGIDLAEFIQFVPGVAGGWPRQVYYLPPFCLSLALTLSAHAVLRRQSFRLRSLLFVFAVIIAPTLLPPAWSPALLRAEAYRVQVVGIAVLLAVALAGPLLGRLPGWAVRTLAVALAVVACVPATVAFGQALPAIEATYRTAFAVGWGPFALWVGWVLCGVSGWWVAGSPRGTAESTREGNAI